MFQDLIDTHCHLNYEYDDGKTHRDLVLEAAQHGVKTLVTIGTDVESFDEIQKISEAYPNVYHTLGVHPHDGSKVDESSLLEIRKRIQHPKCVAVGEIGLDYYYENSSKEDQIWACQQQLKIAAEFQKPVVIHSRDGESDLLPLLQEYAKQQKCSQPIGVIHCFTGTLEFAKACIDLGFVISISGILTFKKSQGLRDTVKQLPIEKLMVETDSPFLAPEPYRGKKCEPSMVRFTAQKLAELFSVSTETIEKVTTRNAKALFRLPK